jgi:hypothetical protein
MLKSTITLLALVATTKAHTAIMHPSSYCFNGNEVGVINLNNNIPVNPFYQNTWEELWFRGISNCLQFPPEDGVFLDLPSGGTLTVELAHNRAQTSWSYDCEYCSDWPDGQNHSEPYQGPGNPPECIQVDGAMHTNNESTAAGTMLAISYEANQADVAMDNLVVISITEQ